MELEVRLPQLDTLLTKIEALSDKIDAMALAAAAPGPVVQPETPAAVWSSPAWVQPEDIEPSLARGKPKRGRKAKPAADGEIEDEDTLRARVEFEEKRVRRLFGINGARAAISGAADGVLRIDDVPVARLTAVLSALQAL
jgi:hypothetical protein